MKYPQHPAVDVVRMKLRRSALLAFRNPGRKAHNISTRSVRVDCVDVLTTVVRDVGDLKYVMAIYTVRVEVDAAKVALRGF